MGLGELLLILVLGLLLFGPEQTLKFVHTLSKTLKKAHQIWAQWSLDDVSINPKKDTPHEHRNP